MSLAAQLLVIEAEITQIFEDNQMKREQKRGALGRSKQEYTRDPWLSSPTNISHQRKWGRGRLGDHSQKL